MTLDEKVDKILQLLTRLTKAHPHCLCHAEVEHCPVHGEQHYPWLEDE